MKKEDCIFCKIANGEIPTNTIYEDEKLIFVSHMYYGGSNYMNSNFL